MKNPYGLRVGRVVLVDDVELGLACACVCAGCGHRLEAHQGKRKTHYFAHDDGAECGHAYQTALHRLAKEVLEEERRLLLPPLRLFPAVGLGSWALRKQIARDVVPPQTTIYADEVFLKDSANRLAVQRLIGQRPPRSVGPASYTQHGSGPDGRGPVGFGRRA